mmetsp:Transcript_39567/g.92695  ORF Transcript_39567/g.92695 Transcript_39567/m.92695 type:complete len:290 (+) Transcript_39567:376-1245(+)
MLRAGPCNCMHPETNSSRSRSPSPFRSMSMKKVQTSSVEMLMDSRKSHRWPCAIALSMSWMLMVSALEKSISSKIFRRVSIWLFVLRSCLRVASSLSALALSIAVLQKTPVTTFKIAKTAMKMYSKSKTVPTTENCRMGRKASSQLIPPQIARNSVSMLSGTLDQYFLKASGQSGTAFGSMVCSMACSRHWSSANCVMAMPNEYDSMRKSRNVQKREPVVAMMDSRSVRKATTYRNSRTSLIPRSARMSRTVRNMRTCPEFASALRAQMSKPTSATDTRTMAKSNMFQP